MKKGIAMEWVKILRSGDIPQTTKRLNRKNGSMCCLGVLCNMAMVKGVCEVGDCEFELAYKFDKDSAVLPNSVKKWAKMKSNLGFLSNGSLATLNDRGSTFSEIADIIEKNWKLL